VHSANVLVRGVRKLTLRSANNCSSLIPQRNAKTSPMSRPSLIESNSIEENRVARSLLTQAWPSLAFWIAFGLLVEGFIGWRTPSIMDDSLRREMFRLAHAHGTLLNLLLIAAAICARLDLLRVGALALFALRFSVIILPLGFLLGGIWHFQSEPGLGVWLVPAGAVLLLWFAVVASLGGRKSQPPSERDGRLS
jgi:hypothetical protein